MIDSSKKERAFLAALWALAAFIWWVSTYETLAAGPLKLVLADELTQSMLIEVLAVFAWNVFWLTRAGRLKKALGVGAGIAVFTWCHRIFAPFFVSGIYAAVLTGAGMGICRLVLKGVKLPRAEECAIGFVMGSALWMCLVCLVSLTGRGGLGLWRGMACILGMATFAWGIRYIIKDRENRRWFQPSLWMPENRLQACLLAFIITMLLIQLGRMNIELDYDSLHYGLRSPFVLDNGKGIYENLGMINLVYTYSKGLEVLALPLSGTPTYGFVLAFSFWMTVGVLLMAARIAGRFGGKASGLWAAVLISAIPGIMNMAATAKSDNITLLHQLIIYDFLCWAVITKREGAKIQAHGSTDRTPWLLLAVAAYLLTLVYKPTALVFSTALGGIGLLYLLFIHRAAFGDRRGWLALILPGCAAAGLWLRTWMFTGVPVTSIFAGIFEKAGFSVKYPYSFTHVIGDPSALTAGEKLQRLGTRLAGMLLAPVSQDMSHVIIAWGTGLVTFLIFAWAVLAAGVKRKGRGALDVFDLFLIPALALGCAASIYTLSQVDGNYFILFYALLAISSARMMGKAGASARLKRGIVMTMVPFFAVNVLITCATGWAGNPGFTPISFKHKGYYDHRAETMRRRILKGNLELSSMFSPRTRVLAFGSHPQVLDLGCSVQSYYDVTGSGGNVYLVKKLAYFEEFLEYAGTEYFYVEAGYLADQPRALQIIEDMIAEGSLTDIRYEWGNMAARVALDREEPEDPNGAVEEFWQNYSMAENHR